MFCFERLLKKLALNQIVIVCTTPWNTSVAKFISQSKKARALILMLPKSYSNWNWEEQEVSESMEMVFYQGNRLSSKDAATMLTKIPKVSDLVLCDHLTSTYEANDYDQAKELESLEYYSGEILLGLPHLRRLKGIRLYITEGQVLNHLVEYLPYMNQLRDFSIRINDPVFLHLLAPETCLTHVVTLEELVRALRTITTLKSVIIRGKTCLNHQILNERAELILGTLPLNVERIELRQETLRPVQGLGESDAQYLFPDTPGTLDLTGHSSAKCDLSPIIQRREYPLSDLFTNLLMLKES